MSLLSDRFDHLHAVSVFIVDFFGLSEFGFYLKLLLEKPSLLNMLITTLKAV